MPRRELLTPAERSHLLAFPTEESELIRRYTFSRPELTCVRAHRGAQNRLGIAIQLSYLRVVTHSGWRPDQHKIVSPRPTSAQQPGPIIGEQLLNLQINDLRYLLGACFAQLKDFPVDGLARSLDRSAKNQRFALKFNPASHLVRQVLKSPIHHR